MGFYSPQPIRVRKKPPLIASSLPKEADDWASVVMQDVYDGLLPHVKRGEVKQICVVQEIEKPNWSPLFNKVPTCSQYACTAGSDSHGATRRGARPRAKAMKPRLPLELSVSSVAIRSP